VKNGVSQGKTETKQTDIDYEEEMRRQRRKDQRERHKIVLWRKPIVTLTYFFLELVILLHDYKERYMVVK